VESIREELWSRRPSQVAAITVPKEYASGIKPGMYLIVGAGTQSGSKTRYGLPIWGIATGRNTSW
jgi:hypothetical protein